MNRLLFSLLTLCVTVFGIQSAMAQDGYRIRTGDLLSVEVVQDPSLNREILVLPDGSINYPFVGTLRVRGLTVGQVQQQIAAGISPNFAVVPDVFVAVSQVYVPPPPVPPVPGPTIDIFIQGEVNAPGLIEVPPGTTLIQALATHGGFTNFAATRRIQLRRPDRHTGHTSVVATLDYRVLERGGNVRHDPVLVEGDVILVPQRRLFE
jgi:polysaccharide export outer membrane protein